MISCFITSQELEEMYPGTHAERAREHLIARAKGAVFVSQIGKDTRFR